MTPGAWDYFDRRFPHFEISMDHSVIAIGAIPSGKTGFKECPDCGELVHTIRYHHVVRYIVAGAKTWSWHQCPQPVDQREADDAQGERRNER